MTQDVPTGWWEWSADTQMLRFSARCAEWLSSPPLRSGVSLLDFLSRVHADDRKAVSDVLATECCRDCTIDCRLVGDDGFERAVRLEGEFIAPSGAGFVRAVGVVLLQRSNEGCSAKSGLTPTSHGTDFEQFVYLISHDFQEPLRMVTGFLNLLVRDYAGRLDSRAQQYITFAVDGATRMYQLVNDMLEYSRTGRQPVNIEELSSEDIVRSVLGGMQPDLDDAGFTINVRDLPDVLADRSSLHRILQNLLSNALKYRNRTAPTLEVFAEPRSGHTVFCIRDNGIGFPSKYAEEVFQMFRRLHTRNECAGNGVGLAICRRLIERMGGRIWAEASENVGASFYFTLPRKPAEPVTVGAAATVVA